jgi:hypothetical protein
MGEDCKIGFEGVRCKNVKIPGSYGEIGKLAASRIGVLRRYL